MRTHRTSRGLTMVETVVSVAIVSLISAGVVGVMGASGRLARRARANQFASQENRRSLERVINALRSASLDSLSGFDANGLSTAPQYNPVIACESDTPVLGPPQVIQWYAAPDRGGALNPGQVDLVAGGFRTCLADRVQSGGFRVVLTGNTMKVFLTTYAPEADGGVVYATGEGSVTIRN